jgi:hypothetical protein
MVRAGLPSTSTWRRVVAGQRFAARKSIAIPRARGPDDDDLDVAIIVPENRSFNENSQRQNE